jgi:hypothetical protein
MPSEPSSPNPSSAAHHESAGQGQHPPVTSGVRGLLGLPKRESGLLSTAPLTAPPRGYHYGQPPLPAREEHDESFPEEAPEEGVLEAGGRVRGDSWSDTPRSVPRAGVTIPQPRPAVAPAPRASATTPPSEPRQQTSFMIPGVSTRKTEFPSLSSTSDPTEVPQAEAAQDPSPHPMATSRASAALPHPRTPGRFASELLTKIEDFIAAGEKEPRDAETSRRAAVVMRSPRPGEHLNMPTSRLAAPLGVPNGERGDTNVARQLTQLRRTVNELAATVAAQAARGRDESHAQGHERTTAPPRLVVVQRGVAAATTPRAFWERSRLGRLHLRTGR